MSEPVDNNSVQSETVSGERNATPRLSNLSDRVRSLRLQNPSTARGSRLRFLPWVLCVVFLFVGAAVGVLGAGALQFLPSAKPATGSVETAKAGSGDVVLEQKGYIIPSRTYQVSPKVGGMVQKLYIQKEGDIFTEGAVLAELENDDYKADVDHSKSALTSARERLGQLRKELPEEIKKAEYDLEQSKSQLRQYTLDYGRAQELFQRQSISKSELDSSQAIKEAKESEVNKLSHGLRLVKGSADERVHALEADVAQNEADLRKSEWRMSNTIIRAPVIDPNRKEHEKSKFTVLTKKAEEGNLVNPIAFNISASICEMADLAKLEVDITIQERDIKHVKEGQPCRIQAEGFPDRKPYPGEVIRVMPNADRAKGAIPVRVKLLSLQPGEKPGEFLRPDTGVIVSFLKTDEAKKEESKQDGKQPDGK